MITRKSGRSILLVVCLVVAGCLPPVPPRPDPEPTTGVSVIVIEETEDRTPVTAAVLGDLKWWQSLSERGIRWRHFDDDAPGAAGYLPGVNGVKRPAVLVMDSTGRKLSAFPLPTSVSELSRRLAEVVR